MTTPLERALQRTIGYLCDSPELQTMADKYLARAIIEEYSREKYIKKEDENMWEEAFQKQKAAGPADFYEEIRRQDKQR